MIKILFVDDEILAMEYLQSMVAWEEHGYQVIGHALNGKKALEIFDRENPQIVISDIKMVGMDGLELTKQLKSRNPDVEVILLSAYCDFEYAQKGIQYGVSNYLLKHELCEEKLLEELGKVKEKLDGVQKKKKIYHKYFIRQLIYDNKELIEEEKRNFGNRFFMLLLQKNQKFSAGTFFEQSWEEQEIEEVILAAEKAVEEGIEYLSEERLSESHMIFLFKISDINSKYIVTKEIERISRRMADSLSVVSRDSFNLIYSNEIKREEISTVFQRMSRQIRYSVFWKSGRIYDLNRILEPAEPIRIDWKEKEGELKEVIYKEKEQVEDCMEYLFEYVQFPSQDLQAFKELVYMLESLLRQIENKESQKQKRNQILNGKLTEIQKYYTEYFQMISRTIQEKEDKKYSRIVLSMIHYINKNFNKELNLEVLGEEFEMNGVYLGQIFKKETGSTFLKYLTNCRIEEAKRLLLDGKRSIYEVSEMVGYKSSQYFSQIFQKNVGITPQEYRKWNRKQ